MRNKRWEFSDERKVCGIDIDGVLNYYPLPWMEFLIRELQCPPYNFRLPKKKDVDLNWIKDRVPYNMYRQLKYYWRKSEEKAEMECREYAPEFLAALKKAEYEIVVLTARPIHQIRSLYRLTIDWLENNNLRYDFIISGKDKHITIIQEVPNLKFMIEDHRDVANRVARWGYKVYLMANDHNDGDLHPNVNRIYGFSEILKYEGLL